MSKTNDINILVLGIGNILLSDEGAGIRVVEQIQRDYIIPESIEIIDGGTMGVELLPWIEGRSHIIIVDAVRSENPPGAVLRIEDVPAFFQNKISPHQIGITDVLAMAYITNDLPPNVVLIGIEPETLSGGIELSDTVSDKIETMVEMVSHEIEEAGVPMKKKMIEETGV